MDYAFISDVEVDVDGRTSRTTFIRLVKPGALSREEVHELHSYTADDATVDLDQDGNVIGVTVFSFS